MGNKNLKRLLERLLAKLKTYLKGGTANNRASAIDEDSHSLMDTTGMCGFCGPSFAGATVENTKFLLAQAEILSTRALQTLARDEKILQSGVDVRYK